MKKNFPYYPIYLDIEDRIVGPVTFRMAAWLAAAVVGVALVVAARGDVALTTVGVVVAAVGVAGAWLRPGGRPLARVRATARGMPAQVA